MPSRILKRVRPSVCPSVIRVEFLRKVSPDFQTQFKVVIFRLWSINRGNARLADERIDRQTNLRMPDCQIHAHNYSLLRENYEKDFYFTVTKKMSAQIRFLGQTNDPTFRFFLSRAKLVSSAASLNSRFFLCRSGAKTQKNKLAAVLISIQYDENWRKASGVRR